MTTLIAAPLNARAFAPFGEVIEIEKARRLEINDGLTTRFDNLCGIDVAEGGGHPILSVFHTKPLPLPHRVKKMERHPLGSQAFLSLDHHPFLVLVATDSDADTIPVAALQLFITDGKQGINFHKNTWHHSQIALHHPSQSFVIDRAGPGQNLEEAAVSGEAWIKAELPP